MLTYLIKVESYFLKNQAWGLKYFATTLCYAYPPISQTSALYSFLPYTFPAKEQIAEHSLRFAGRLNEGLIDGPAMRLVGHSLRMPLKQQNKTASFDLHSLNHAVVATGNNF